MDLSTCFTAYIGGMIMKRLLTLFTLFTLVQPAHAVLAPDIERAREVAAVTEAVQKRFPGQAIKSVTPREDFGTYDVVVGRCRLKAATVTMPMPDGLVGPRRFTVKLSRAKCGSAIR